MFNFLLSLVGTDNKPDAEIGLDFGVEEFIIGIVLGVVITLIVQFLIKDFNTNADNKNAPSDEEKNEINIDKE